MSPLLYVLHTYANFDPNTNGPTFNVNFGHQLPKGGILIFWYLVSDSKVQRKDLFRI